MSALRVVQCGLGPIGASIARLLLATPGLQLVGAADPSPQVAGKDLGVVLDLPKKLKIKIGDDPDAFLKAAKADIAILCTSSSMAEVQPQVAALVKNGIRVVTTCEELAFPVPERSAAWKELDALAKKKKVAVLGAGVNPGFVMDLLPLFLTAACTEVNRVSVTRVVDVATRRLSLQRKVGAGLHLAQFRRAVTERTVRHAGLLESLYMIATTLGWKLDEVKEFPPEPVVAPRDLETGELLRVPAGHASGLRQTARAWRKGEVAITLDLQMYVKAENPRDHIVIDGTPPIDLTIAGGVSGDTATAALVVNCIPRLMAAPPGLVTMRDLPLVHRIDPHQLAR